MQNEKKLIILTNKLWLKYCTDEIMHAIFKLI